MRQFLLATALLLSVLLNAQPKPITLEYAHGLYLDVYSSETNETAPLIVLMHGGGFVKGSKELLAQEAQRFAQLGFVAATVNYTLGKDCTTDSLALEHAILRARNNMVEAVNFLVDHNEEYRIASDWIFLGGQSAGAITSLAVAYLNEESCQHLGPPENYTLLPLKAPVKGIYNNWGAAFPFYFEANNWVPLVSFHGVYDAKVPAGKGLTNSCKNRLPFWGAMSLAELARTNQWSCSTTLVNSNKHGVLLSENETKLRVERAAKFFREIMQNRTVFEEFMQ